MGFSSGELSAVILVFRFPLQKFHLRKEQMVVVIAGQHVVHQDGGPAAVLAQTHLVGSLRTQRAGHHHCLQQLGTLGQDGQSTQEPATLRRSIQKIQNLP